MAYGYLKEHSDGKPLCTSFRIVRDDEREHLRVPAVVVQSKNVTDRQNDWRTRSLQCMSTIFSVLAIQGRDKDSHKDTPWIGQTGFSGLRFDPFRIVGALQRRQPRQSDVDGAKTTDQNDSSEGQDTATDDPVLVLKMPKLVPAKPVSRRIMTAGRDTGTSLVLLRTCNLSQSSEKLYSTQGGSSCSRLCVG